MRVLSPACPSLGGQGQCPQRTGVVLLPPARPQWHRAGEVRSMGCTPGKSGEQAPGSQGSAGEQVPDQSLKSTSRSEAHLPRSSGSRSANPLCLRSPEITRGGAAAPPQSDRGPPPLQPVSGQEIKQWEGSAIAGLEPQEPGAGPITTLTAPLLLVHAGMRASSSRSPPPARTPLVTWGRPSSHQFRRKGGQAFTKVMRPWPPAALHRAYCSRQCPPGQAWAWTSAWARASQAPTANPVSSAPLRAGSHTTRPGEGAAPGPQQLCQLVRSSAARPGLACAHNFGRLASDSPQESGLS
ncbi:hypothetical protein NDU88_003323 [Pleurodeles waltl]|uniref:Uncharacterized protein n=1 Tax=Pleurodeles waltl TaxID=8319 RepID=A0AAV7TQ91_PLEWA|nr:hypothetical protein NDU88_003323 [Pleurodeles waltl]